MTTDRIFTIAPDRPFVDDLARALLNEVANAPERLAAHRVLLPTRRACRSLREAFLRATRGRPLLLPQMTPIGDVDEDDLSLSDSDPGRLLSSGPPLDPPIGGLRRQILLARIIMADKSRNTSPERAVELAAELALLLDRIQTERIPLASIPETFPAELSAHWERVLAFLRILLAHWPNILKDEGKLDFADHRDRALGALAALWRKRPPEGPIIAAGSTGSIPATADLLKTVAELPEGAVVLPGLDQGMDEGSWDLLESSHPQWGLKTLLAKLEVERGAVRPWPGTEPRQSPRVRLLGEVTRASETTERWADMSLDMESALVGVKRIDAPSPGEEAAAVALVMRGVVETPEIRCALVTPDRGLARRVAAMLKRWNLTVDDSAGLPLSRTEAGTFFDLLSEAVADDFAPAAFLALLKHPFCLANRKRTELLRLARALEIAALRGPRPAAGLEGVARTLDKKPEMLESLLADIGSATIAFAKALSTETTPAELVRAHVEAAEALSKPDMLWSGEAGEAMSAFLGELAEATEDQPPMAGERYGPWFKSLMRRRVVRPRRGQHPRLFIRGAMEARLQSVDVMILGGLNEGTWPPSVETGPWMSRPMMRKLGFPLPERRIGLSAHDFQQAFAAPEVWLTRSTRVDGAPTTPSRWLARLENLLKGAGRPGLIQDDRHLAWAEHLDLRLKRQKTEPPAPRPPLTARPTALPVTAVETWIRDPYALYAERILNLRALEPIDADPGAADRGSIVHDVLEDFIAAHPDTLPDDAERVLIDIGKRRFERFETRPAVRAFWWPRFRRVAKWFVEAEVERRAEGWRPVAMEKTGAATIKGLVHDFTIKAKADRIDRGPDGLAVIDYKTGQVPSLKQVESGLGPQLTLEAHIAEQGGFDGLGAETVTELLYVKLSGGGEPGTLQGIADNEKDAGILIAEAVAGLTRLVVRYQSADMPYLAIPRVQFLTNRRSDYDHLARVKAWEDEA